MILSDNNTPAVLLFDEIVQKSPTFFKILIEPALVQKSTIPRMEALLFSYLEPEGWCHALIMGAPRPLPVKLFATFFSEAVEAKRVDFFKKKFIKSNVRISWMYRYRFYDLKAYFWWPNKLLFSYIQRWNTLYYLSMISYWNH